MPSLAGATLIALAAMLVLTALAQGAAFEQVRQFQAPGPNSELANVRSVAVNINGAGGAPPGSLYTVAPVLRGGFKFEELVRLEPDGEVKEALGPAGAISISINQRSGEIFILTPTGSIQRRSPAGTLIETFGQQDPSPESIENSPSVFHQATSIAVDQSGIVYVGDIGFAAAETPQSSRVMVFEETAGAYGYAGRSRDMARKTGPEKLAVDSNDHLDIISLGREILQYEIAAPGVPQCTLATTGGLQGLAVNSETGEIVFTSGKDGKGHQILCDSVTGEFSADTSFAVKPPPSAGRLVEALAINPMDMVNDVPGRPPGALYVISNEGGGYLFAKTPGQEPPQIISESVDGVGTNAANVSAVVNPKGAATEYFFQYETEAAFQLNSPGEPFAGASQAPVGGASLPLVSEQRIVATPLAGLAPAVRYRYRIVLMSEGLEVTGPSEAFETYLDPGSLADRRAYELVSPPNKSYGEVLPPYVPEGIACLTGSCALGQAFGHYPMQATADGEALAFEGQPFLAGQGGVNENAYLARRGPTGWSTTGLTPSSMVSGSNSGGVDGYSRDLSADVLLQSHPPLTESAPQNLSSLYRQETGNPTVFESLLRNESEQNYHRGANELSIAFVGGDTSYSKLVFQADDALTAATSVAPEAADGGKEDANIYEFEDGELRLVNVKPGNATTQAGAVAGSGSILDSFRPVIDHAVSSDGSHIFWTAASGQLYVRLDGSSSEPIGGPTECVAGRAFDEQGCFLTASEDGARVLLTSGKEYVQEPGTSEYVESGDLTQGQGGFLGISGQSSDLSTVYFVASSVLAGANVSGQAPSEGRDNLYLSRGGSVTFIAILSPEDSPTPVTAHSVGSWSPVASMREAEASEDGQWLTFRSIEPLTGYDNVGPCEVKGGVGQGAVSDAPCSEIFLYNAATEELDCVSCNRSGPAPLGKSTLPFVEGVASTAGQQHYLTDRGRVYFNTLDSLVPADSNNGVEDVYEFEPSGIQTCVNAAGCVSLISAGNGAQASQLLTVDNSGKNVFFTTRDRLVPPDKDELFDIYDAREGGGVPAWTSDLPGSCSGETCQAAQAPPAEISSASLKSPEGNAPCKKGLVKRSGRCVKKQNPKKHKHKSKQSKKSKSKQSKRKGHSHRPQHGSKSSKGANR